jgi:hypothetical protein
MRMDLALLQFSVASPILQLKVEDARSKQPALVDWELTGSAETVGDFPVRVH